jgi:uncharacterized protein DUF6894
MRCYFHLIKGDDVISDDLGVEVSDLDHARAEAITAIAEIKAQCPRLASEGAGWTLTVTDPGGTILITIRVEDVGLAS